MGSIWQDKRRNLFFLSCGTSSPVGFLKGLEDKAVFLGMKAGVVAAYEMIALMRFY